MSDVSDPIPNTTNQCGTFTDPTTKDSGLSYKAAFSPGCEAPTDTVDGEAEIVFIDGVPQALEV